MWRRLDSVDCPIMRRAWLTLLLNHASTDVTFGYVTRAQLTGHMREAVEILAGRLLAYLDAKLERNVEREGQNRQALEDAGWEVLIVWECETTDLCVLEDRLHDFLQS